MFPRPSPFTLDSAQDDSDCALRPFHEKAGFVKADVAARALMLGVTFASFPFALLVSRF